MKMTRIAGSLVLGVGLMAGSALAADDKPAAAGVSEQAAGVTILQTRVWGDKGKVCTGTIWRTFQTWQTDVARNETGSTGSPQAGELVRVNPMTPRAWRSDKGEVVRQGSGWTDRVKSSWKLELCPADEVHGSAYPPANWQALNFDDSTWTRDPAPQMVPYGLVALRCLRGKFEVTDPAKAGDVSLTVQFRGGAVAYINGKEIGRVFLPKGELKPDTLADDYPKDTFIDSEGMVIQAIRPWEGRFNSKDPQVEEKVKSRTRELKVTIAATLLKKGTNVLAIEIHRAPALVDMFLSPCYFEGKKNNIIFKHLENFWDRSELEDVKLVATGTGVVPNIAPPKGVSAWTHPVCEDVDPAFYGDPCESLAPIHLRGVKNGTYSGQIVVSSTETIKGMKATVTDLKGPAGTIPAASVKIGYPKPADGYTANNTLEIGEGAMTAHSGCEWPLYDIIEPEAPKEVTKVAWGRKRVFQPMQPVWFTVKVPVDAKAGKYSGTVTVSLEGQNPITTTLEMEVVGNWVLPDSKEFKTYVGMLECPDALAKKYNLKLWSEEHWKMMDKVYEVLGQMGTKEIWIPFVAKSHLGNQNSMVRWIKQADGTYKADFSIVEKFLDLAMKHLGKAPSICVFIKQPQQTDQPICTELDPKTGELKELLPPKWATPESLVFWKPVIQRMQEILAKRGVEKNMTFGYLIDSMASSPKEPNFFTDLRTITPTTRWMVTTHVNVISWRAGEVRNVDFLANHSLMFASLNNASWMDESDGPSAKLQYGWRDRQLPPITLIAPSRSRTSLPDNDYCANVSRLRYTTEAVMMCSTYQGFGSWGADFWGLEWYMFQANGGGQFGNVGLSESMAQWFVGPGEKGPVSTCRGRMIQESLQEAEARIFVQDALLDQAQKLGPDLAKRCKAICDERTRMLTYIDRFRYNNHSSSMPRARMIPDAAAWEDDAVKLYRLAEEVEKVAGK